MLTVIRGTKNFQNIPIQEIWHNDGDQILAYMRKDLVFVFNFNPKQSFTDYGFLVPEGAYEVILNTDNPAYGGNGLTDDTVTHFTMPDPLYKKDKKGWMKLYVLHVLPWCSDVRNKEEHIIRIINFELQT